MPLLFSPLAALYALGWWSYQAAYDFKIKQPFEPHRPIVVVGNLLVGGAGKTPTALFVADCLQSMGRPLVLSVSGYGSPASRSATLAPEGELDAAEWGDEPAMVRWLRPELPLIVGRDRVEAARLAHVHYPDRVLLLDDGYQHLRLRTHVKILLDPQSGNRFCLPAGPYREPRFTGVKRADVVLPNDRFQVFASSMDWTPEPPVGEVQLLCALARPARLLDSLEGLGLNVVKGRLLPDHDRFQDRRLWDEFDPALPLVVSAKDWVKLRGRPEVARFDVRVVNYSVAVEPAAAFREWLKARLDDVEAAHA